MNPADMLQSIHNIDQAMNDDDPNNDGQVIGQEMRKINVDFVQALDKEIDKFIAELKQRLLSQSGPQRGVWDRMKNWWSNMWRGRYNQSNPYYWQNKLGDDLGTVGNESVLSMGLKEFHVLKGLATDLENELNKLNEDMTDLPLPRGTGNLRISSILDNWAKRFKASVHQLAQNKLGIDLSNLPEVPTAEPEAELEPQQSVPTKPASGQLEPSDVEDQDLGDKGGSPTDQVSDPAAQVSEPEDEELQQGDGGDDNIGQDAPVDSAEPEESDDPFAIPKPSNDKDAIETVGNFKISESGIRKLHLKGRATWQAMTPEEQHEYDVKGGGTWKVVSHRRAAYKAGIRTLPYFLSKNDPRYWILLGLEGNVAGRRTRHEFNTMAKNGQIDGVSYAKEKRGEIGTVYPPGPEVGDNPEALAQKIAEIKSRLASVHKEISKRNKKGSETKKQKREREEREEAERQAGVASTLSEPVDDNIGQTPPPKAEDESPPADEVGSGEKSGGDASTAAVSPPPKAKDEEGMSEGDRQEIESAIAKLNPEENKELIDAARQMMDSGMFSKEDILASLPGGNEDGEFDGDGGWFKEHAVALSKVLKKMNLSERKEHLKGLLQKEGKRTLPSKRKMKGMTWEEKVQYLKEYINV